MMELFPREQFAGVFKGFSNGGMEFHADITLPYKEKLHNVPMHGQFLLVKLENPNEAVLGRICSLSADGKLASSAGEQYSIRAVDDSREIPEYLREAYLKYRVDIRVLGVVRVDDEKLIFAPSHRRLPHVGSEVAFLSDEILRHVCGATKNGADIGHFALGEYIYSGNDNRAQVELWHQVKSPNITIKFDIHSLVSRRTFVFARAGYGKSNLNKLLFKNLYEETPVIIKKNGKKVPVGTIVFDPDGEYFWPDDQGRPGLCDVPALKDQIVVFTSRDAPSAFYGSFKAGQVKLDIRELVPSDVISIALSPEKQDQQNVRKLRGLSSSAWGELVDLIHKDGNFADSEVIKKLLGISDTGDAEINAARSNMTAIVRMLHDPASQLMRKLLESLKEGKLCIVDISSLRGGPSLILAGLILRKVFQHNQNEFTKANSQAIPTIAVIEEAQSVLGSHSTSSEPFIEWVKEGRKYGLGAFLVTQQPGSISTDILSQGDNWFMFHLLSETDLRTAKSANAHFSNDLLSSLLNEPIKGQGVFWSSEGNTIYPIPIRVMSFEKEVGGAIDKDYSMDACDCFAARLKDGFDSVVSSLKKDYSSDTESSSELLYDNDGIEIQSEDVDPRAMIINKMMVILRNSEDIKKKIESGDSFAKGYFWHIVKNKIGNDYSKIADDDLIWRAIESFIDEVRRSGYTDTITKQNDKNGKVKYYISFNKD